MQTGRRRLPAVAWIGLALIVIAAVVVGALLFGDDHSKPRDRGHHIEAQLQLKKIGISAKLFFVSQGHFPLGRVGLTPAIACCDGPNHLCGAGGSLWTAQPWRDLDFQIDEPMHYQYEYESGDGRSFIVHAFGTFDCALSPEMWTLRGSVENGQPVVQVEAP